MVRSRTFFLQMEMKAESKDVGEGGGSFTSAAKAEQKDGGGLVSMGQQREAPSLVHKLVDYAFRMLNEDMGEFFARHAQVFDQSAEEVRQQGETVDQYVIYQEYLKLLEEGLEEFVRKEGFSDIQACYAQVEEEVRSDAKRHEEQMKQLMAHLQQITRQARGEDSKEGGSDIKEGGSDAKDGADKGDQAGIPMVVLFQPITLEKLVDMVLNLSEYTTFSLMMRMKVSQMKMMEILKAQAKQIEERVSHACEQVKKERDAKELKIEELDINID